MNISLYHNHEHEDCEEKIELMRKNEWKNDCKDFLPKIVVKNRVIIILLMAWKWTKKK